MRLYRSIFFVIISVLLLSFNGFDNSESGRHSLFHDLRSNTVKPNNEFARYFSNAPKSYKSSLGFYITGDTYYGKHGLSLYLDGMEEGFNDNARERAIVMHGAEYVSNNFIKKYGRLGRSFGCPSVPIELHKEIIRTIKGGTCLFIFYPDQKYESSSELLNARF
ncbi:MAG: murein L,D-transpeptidase catalytic domain family protein [Bacteroidota bacterium]